MDEHGWTFTPLETPTLLEDKATREQLQKWLQELLYS